MVDVNMQSKTKERKANEAIQSPAHDDNTQDDRQHAKATGAPSNQDQPAIRIPVPAIPAPAAPPPTPAGGEPQHEFATLRKSC